MVPVIRSLRPGQLRSVYALSRALKQMDLRHIPLSEDLSPLRLPVRIGSRTVPNAMAVQPLEGFDGMEDGSPSPSVFRRYEAFAASGAGLIWFESVSVSPDGRDAPHQLSITPQNAANFRALAQAADAARVREWGLPPVKILQLTHSGRNSFQTPLTAFHSPYLDPFYPKSLTVLSDHDLDVLSERTYQSAMLAQEAGFDGIDLKF